jgi:hypothetical protein
VALKYLILPPSAFAKTSTDGNLFNKICCTHQGRLSKPWEHFCKLYFAMHLKDAEYSRQSHTLHTVCQQFPNVPLVFCPMYTK